MRIKISAGLHNYMAANPAFQAADVGQYIVCDVDFRVVRIQDCLSSWAAPTFLKRGKDKFERVA